MDRWKKFERNATDYLQKKFSNNKDVEFSWVGKSNSNKSDIIVFKNNDNIINIEAKLSPSQSGQFVVKIKNNKFVFSTNNIYSQNIYSQKIISYLNQNKEKINLKEANFKLKHSSKLFNSWITNHYNNKNCKFIITSNKLDSFYALIPLNKLSEYFNSTATLRRKRSGTRHLPKGERNQVVNILKNHLCNIKLRLTDLKHTNRKTIIKLNRSLNKNECYFGNERYYLSKTQELENHKYFIKKRSLTNNINVIFSVEYTGPFENFGLKGLKKEIDKH